MIYATTTHLTKTHAQGIQIREMAKAFSQVLGAGFVLLSPKVDTTEIERVRWIQVGLYLRNRKLRYLLMMWRLILLLIGRKDEIVFTRDIGLALVSSFFTKSVIYEMHKPFETKFGNLFFKFTHKRIYFVSITDALRDFMVKKYQMDSKRILVSHDAVDISLYDKFREISKDEHREYLGLPVDKSLVTYTGSLQPGKGLEYFGVIAEAFPDVLCLSVGGDTSLVDQWRTKYKTYKNIMFVPHQDKVDVIRYQLAADVLLFATNRKSVIWWCSSPLKAFEYLAAQTPVVSSAEQGPAEVLTQDVCTPFSEQNHETLINAINKALSKSEDILRKAEKGLTIVREKYTWRKRANDILHWINSSSQSMG